MSEVVKKYSVKRCSNRGLHEFRHMLQERAKRLVCDQIMRRILGPYLDDCYLILVCPTMLPMTLFSEQISVTALYTLFITKNGSSWDAKFGIGKICYINDHIALLFWQAIGRHYSQDITVGENTWITKSSNKFFISKGWSTNASDIIEVQIGSY